MPYEMGNAGDMRNIFTNLGVDPYPIEYLPYTEIVGETGDGRPVEMGPPTCTWRFRILRQWQYEWLLWWWRRQFSPTLDPVRITTRIESGVTLSFSTFSCIMWRPTSTVIPGKYRADVVVKFTQLEEV